MSGLLHTHLLETSACNADGTAAAPSPKCTDAELEIHPRRCFTVSPEFACFDKARSSSRYAVLWHYLSYSATATFPGFNCRLSQLVLGHDVVGITNKDLAELNQLLPSLRQLTFHQANFIGVSL